MAKISIYIYIEVAPVINGFKAGLNVHHPLTIFNLGPIQVAVIFRTESISTYAPCSTYSIPAKVIHRRTALLCYHPFWLSRTVPYIHLHSRRTCGSVLRSLHRIDNCPFVQSCSSVLLGRGRRGLEKWD